jgi:hypothetical protein
MADLFATVADLAKSGYVFRIQDNGAATADRYTVVFSDGDYLALSAFPSHPSYGVSLWGENLNPQTLADDVENGDAVDLALGDLPEGLADHIRARINEAWRDFLEAGEAGDPSAVAPDRETAQTYEGLHDQGGVGIYRAPDGFRVKDDNSYGAADPQAADPGPFATFREAFLNTLPQDYSLSGPEYHSPEEVARLDPSNEVAGAVAALAHKVGAMDSGWTVRQVAYGLPGERWLAVAPTGEESAEVDSEAKAWALADSD